MIRMKATLVMYYDADPKHYGTDDPAAMAAIDQKNFEDYPQDLLLDDAEVTVEPA